MEPSVCKGKAFRRTIYFIRLLSTKNATSPKFEKLVQK
nr:MAG TPA: hypothetical protein [Caudoviricetes sp.]